MAGETGIDLLRPSPPVTLTITRDNNCGAGFRTAMLSTEELSACTIGEVDQDGPASRGGMEPHHVGWHIISVNSVPVTADTAAAELARTREPGRQFTLVIRPPLLGELTNDESGTGRVNVTPSFGVDGDIHIEATAGVDGTTRISVRVANTAANFLRSHGAGIERIEQSLSNAMEQMVGTLRPEEQDAIREEQDREMPFDTVTEVVDDQCIACTDRARAVVFDPCRHLISCRTCAVILRRGNCPFCRIAIQNTILLQDVPDGARVVKPA